MSDNCIFCKIVKGEIPCSKIYEDEIVFAFLDISPLNLGHTLIIPKEHYRWVWDIQDIGPFYESVQKVAKAIQKAMETEWIVSLVIGEAVPHAHVWLIPRLKNDGHGASIDLKNTKKISPEEMKKIAEKIKSFL